MNSDLIPALIAAAAVLCTALPLLRHEAWWIRAFEFPRLQIALVTALVLAAYVTFAGVDRSRDLVIVIVLSLCVALQVFRIWPYTAMHRRQVKDALRRNPENAVSLLVVNVWMPNREAELLLHLIQEKEPDLILAVETDDWWDSKLGALEQDYPYSVKYPLSNMYGMHLYSRLELIDPRLKFLIEEDVPSIHTGVRLRSGHLVELHCLHPAPPSPTENPTAEERDAELLMVAKALDAEAKPVIVCGDLNDVAWSYTTRLFQRVSRLIDPRVGRGMYSTFHARYPFLRWPLDHVFFSSDFSLVALERLPYFGSDHFPIFVEICLEPKAEESQDAPEPESGDESRARDKVETAGVNEPLT